MFNSMAIMKQRRVVLRRRKFVISVSAAIATLLMVVGSLSFTNSPSEAADLSKFQAGNIISDSVFFNPNTMSEASIQQFLNSKVSSCASGKVCLKDFKQSTYTRSADAMCSSYVGAANEPAARIIYKVAQACGINPQVILVMLQKEQSLVLSNAPTSWAWQASMGYACPDTAACDSKYFGFYNQVYMGVWQLKRYGNPPGTSQAFTWYPVGKTSQIRYSPTASCGSGPVYIENKATAALYYYTPYQPNAAALAAGYGPAAGDCGAYGNRNFYNWFTDWFGSPAGPVDPLAYIDVATLVETGSSAEIRLSGWAADRTNISKSIEVHVYLDRPDGTTTGKVLVANSDRPDVAGAYPGAGPKHGYSTALPITKPGSYRMCVFPVTATGAWLLDCRTFIAAAADPVGAFDSADIVQEDGKASIKVAGWGMNLSSPTTAAEMNFYVSGPDGKVRGFAFPADKPRADVERAYPGTGPNHGFTNSIALVGAGAYEVCAYVNAGSPYGSSVNFLGCKQLRAQASAPFGSWDYLSQKTANGKTSITFGGWAIDAALPTSPINVDVYVDRPNGTSAGIRTMADTERRDVAAAFPGTGASHGFTGSLEVSAPGVYRACAYAIGVSVYGAGNGHLGCKTVTVPSATVTGSFDAAVPISNPSGKFIEVRGWAVDPANPTASGPVDVYVDSPDGKSRGYRLTADKSRPDIARIFPAYGEKHGLNDQLSVSLPGKHRVCAFGIPTSAFGQSALLGCISVDIPR